MREEALLVLDGYAGRINKRCIVVGETPKKYRITPVLDEVIVLPGTRLLNPGESALVPKAAVFIRGSAA